MHPNLAITILSLVSLVSQTQGSEPKQRSLYPRSPPKLKFGHRLYISSTTSPSIAFRKGLLPGSNPWNERDRLNLKLSTPGLAQVSIIAHTTLRGAVGAVRESIGENDWKLNMRVYLYEVSNGPDVITIGPYERYPPDVVAFSRLGTWKSNRILRCAPMPLSLRLVWPEKETGMGQLLHRLVWQDYKDWESRPDRLKSLRHQLKLKMQQSSRLKINTRDSRLWLAGLVEPEPERVLYIVSAMQTRIGFVRGIPSMVSGAGSRAKLLMQFETAWPPLIRSPVHQTVVAHKSKETAIRAFLLYKSETYLNRIGLWLYEIERKDVLPIPMVWTTTKTPLAPMTHAEDRMRSAGRNFGPVLRAAHMPLYERINSAQSGSIDQLVDSLIWIRAVDNVKRLRARIRGEPLSPEPAGGDTSSMSDESSVDDPKEIPDPGGASAVSLDALLADSSMPWNSDGRGETTQGQLDPTEMPSTSTSAEGELSEFDMNSFLIFDKKTQSPAPPPSKVAATTDQARPPAEHSDDIDADSLLDVDLGDSMPELSDSELDAMLSYLRGSPSTVEETAEDALILVMGENLEKQKHVYTEDALLNMLSEIPLLDSTTEESSVVADLSSGEAAPRNLDRYPPNSPRGEESPPSSAGPVLEPVKPPSDEPLLPILDRYLPKDPLAGSSSSSADRFVEPANPLPPSLDRYLPEDPLAESSSSSSSSSSAGSLPEPANTKDVSLAAEDEPMLLKLLRLPNIPKGKPSRKNKGRKRIKGKKLTRCCTQGQLSKRDCVPCPHRAKDRKQERKKAVQAVQAGRKKKKVGPGPAPHRHPGTANLRKLAEEKTVSEFRILTEKLGIPEEKTPSRKGRSSRTSSWVKRWGFPAALTAVTLPLYVADVVYVFESASATTMDKVAAVTAIIPFVGCTARLQSKMEKGETDVLTTLDAAVCFTTDALIFTPLMPVAIVINFAYGMIRSIPLLEEHHALTLRDRQWEKRYGDIVAHYESEKWAAKMRAWFAAEMADIASVVAEKRGWLAAGETVAKTTSLNSTALRRIKRAVAPAYRATEQMLCASIQRSRRRALAEVPGRDWLRKEAEKLNEEFIDGYMTRAKKAVMAAGQSRFLQPSQSQDLYRFNGLSVRQQKRLNERVGPIIQKLRRDGPQVKADEFAARIQFLTGQIIALPTDCDCPASIEEIKALRSRSSPEKLEATFPCAASNRFVNVINKLTLWLVNPNARDAKGNTALMLASEKGYDDVVRLLLRAGTGPPLAERYPEAGKRTAWYPGWAMAQEMDRAGRERARAKLHVRNERGDTALALAERNGHEVIVRLLRGELVGKGTGGSK
ncbi:hypothetical protein GQ602_005732 [Ophiocordyceps camponoti-floridani]|uniref:Uncharacterized protein n=1 Tax=Ophiocordyceps camponoti-floridani TaxID=2030778 RepID=A0A8H4Q3X7_9HYPO|nr:hypothetical protein GQ602_005732 [Ophiocordyceps camponoti-floridani]